MGEKDSKLTKKTTKKEITNRPKKSRQLNLFNNFYLQGNLSDLQVHQLEQLLRMGKVDKLKHVIPESAELFKRDCEDIVLYDAQTLAVGMSYINPYFFIGDKPGLGKTIMSAAIYAQLRKKNLELDIKTGKLMVVTDNNHVLGTKKDFARCGINLIALKGGTQAINKDTKNFDMRDPLIDGVVTSWDSLKTNGFLMFYLENRELFTLGIMDETSTLKSDKTQLYAQADKIAINFERNVFLNASTFETSIMDIYNQFQILNPTVIPTKKFINDRYVIQGKESWHETDYVTDYRTGQIIPQRVMKYAYRIADYTNQAELRQRLRYQYIARTKADYSDDLPEKLYILHPVEMTERMRRGVVEHPQRYNEILNSPTTIDKNLKFNFQTVPKFQVAVDLFESIAFERPVIYCFNNESQRALKAELQSRGFRIEIISGEENVAGEGRDKVLEEFKEGYYDGLITNVKKAVNMIGSQAMIFYDIPTNPQIAYQIMGRIDRNNFTEKRTYHFLVYMNSPEMFNMAELANFREVNSSLFTGQHEEVYKQLIKQLEAHL